MKRSRFSEKQNIGLLMEHEAGMPILEDCRKYGVSDASIKKMGGQIRRHGSNGGQAAQDAGGREREA